MPVPSNRRRTWGSEPHIGGGEANAGEGGRCAPTVRKRSPMELSGVQLQIPNLPPGRRTRAISRAATSCRGANMQPKVETTRSKLASSNGSASASPSTQATSTPSFAASRRPSSSSSGVRSSPATRAPAAAARMAAFPVPHALHLEGLDDPLPDVPELALRDRRVVAGRPRLVRAPLQVLKLDDGHRGPPCQHDEGSAIERPQPVVGFRRRRSITHRRTMSAASSQRIDENRYLAAGSRSPWRTANTAAWARRLKPNFDSTWWTWARPSCVRGTGARRSAGWTIPRRRGPGPPARAW